jgi:hypothetical protein
MQAVTPVESPPCGSRFNTGPSSASDTAQSDGIAAAGASGPTSEAQGQPGSQAPGACHGLGSVEEYPDLPLPEQTPEALQICGMVQHMMDPDHGTHVSGLHRLLDYLDACLPHRRLEVACLVISKGALRGLSTMLEAPECMACQQCSDVSNAAMQHSALYLLMRLDGPVMSRLTSPGHTTDKTLRLFGALTSLNHFYKRCTKADVHVGVAIRCHAHSTRETLQPYIEHLENWLLRLPQILA